MAYTLQIDFRSYLLYQPALLYNIYAMKKKEKRKNKKKKYLSSIGFEPASKTVCDGFQESASIHYTTLDSDNTDTIIVFNFLLLIRGRRLVPQILPVCEKRLSSKISIHKATEHVC